MICLEQIFDLIGDSEMGCLADRDELDYHNFINLSLLFTPR